MSEDYADMPAVAAGQDAASPILFALEDGVAHLTFNRPASLNAMDFAMGELWRDLGEWVASDPAVKAVLLDATGPAFCAGGDVIAMGSAGADGGSVAGADVTAMAGVIHAGIRAIVESDVPVVAAVQGAVAGGGLGLMLTADWIVAADTAKFSSKYANIGLSPDLGVSTLLPAAIGQRRALQLVLQDVTVDAATALDWGLVTEVVPRDEVAGRARAVADGWVSGAWEAYGEAKRLVRTGAHRTFGENLADEAATIGALFDTDEARARVAGFAAASRSRRS
nr:enoyl-CoA hydratase-related protein [Microbacterium mangrovi]